MRVAIAVIEVALFLFLSVVSTADAQEEAVLAFRSSSSARSSSPPAEPLSFNEFFEGSDYELKPSKKLLSLHGKRVRLVGYMARMEDSPEGAFYLTPYRVACDEEGGGTADLPVESVKVIVRSARGRKIAAIPRPIEVVGILEVGNQEDEEGHVSAFRLILDRPIAVSRSKAKQHSPRGGK